MIKLYRKIENWLTNLEYECVFVCMCVCVVYMLCECMYFEGKGSNTI